MGFFGYVKNTARNFLNRKAPVQHEEIDPLPKPMDTNRNKIPDMFEAPRRSNQREVHLLNPAKDEHIDITKNKHGHYVSTLSYPLPPLSWEEKQFKNNRRMRNSKNKYL